MKKILLFLALMLSCGALWGQKVLVLVYAVSDDGFVNVRAEPSARAKIVAKIYEPDHGLAEAMLIEEGNPWCKVRVGKYTGWANKKYLGFQSWFENNGGPRLVAAKDRTPILGEDYSGEGHYPLLMTVKRGTIIADDYLETDDFYILQTAHDNLLISKEDVTVVGGD